MFPVKVFATDGSDELARKICIELAERLPKHLQWEDMQLANSHVVRFANQNPEAQIDNVRGNFAVIIHTQVPPVGEHVIDLLALLDAIVESHPSDVLLVMPYMPFSRSDRKNKPRISVMSSRFARILSESFGIKRVLLLDPHDTHLKHYFTPAADEITAVHLIIDFLRRKHFTEFGSDNHVIVFADNGAATRFEKVPRAMGLRSVYIDKSHLETADESAKPKCVVGDVSGRDCILFDDEALTFTTAQRDAEALLEVGAASVVLVAVHGALMSSDDPTGSAVISRVEASPFRRVIVTNSIPIEHKIGAGSKIHVLPAQGLIAEAIKRTVQNESLTVLHEPVNVKLYRQD